jgi:hypothetical protein
VHTIEDVLASSTDASFWVLFALAIILPISQPAYVLVSRITVLVPSYLYSLPRRPVLFVRTFAVPLDPGPSLSLSESDKHTSLTESHLAHEIFELAEVHAFLVRFYNLMKGISNCRKKGASFVSMRSPCVSSSV